MTGAPDSGAAVRTVLVDDTADFRKIMRMALERTGDYQIVGEAEDGQQALDVVRAHNPDLVLLDVAMPVMDGLQALPLIRGVCPNAALVMLTGFNASKMKAQAEALGADGFFEKGHPLRDLVAGLLTVTVQTGIRRPC